MERREFLAAAALGSVGVSIPRLRLTQIQEVA